MARRPKTRPASGSDRALAADLCNRPNVLRLLLLWGSYRDDFSQDAVTRELAQLTPAVVVKPQGLPALYHAVLDHLEQWAQKRRAA